MRFSGGPTVEVTKSPESSGATFIEKDAETRSPELFKKIVEFAGEHFEMNAVTARNTVKNMLSKGGKIFYVLDREKVVAIGGTQPDPETGPSGARELRRGIGFNLAAVDPDHRRSGVYARINEERFREALAMRAAFIYTDTQNPVVELTFKKALQKLVKEKRIKSFTFERRLSVGGLRRKFTREAPGKSGDSEIDEAYGKLDIHTGEMFQLYFHLEYP